MRFHFSFHKSLTKYTSLTLNRTLNNLSLRKTGYKHFNSMKNDFIKEAPHLNMASLNNHFLPLEELEAVSGEQNTCSLFIRDPRDLLVSGYFYHKKGVEPWTKVQNPLESDYEVVNGKIPAAVRESGLSLHEYLNCCGMGEGLLIELEFREKHFDNLSKWLAYIDPRILFIDYFEIMADEKQAFLRLGKHHNFNAVQATALAYFVNKYKASNSRNNTHIRNPSPGQWKKTLTRECLEVLDQRFPELISRYENKKHAD